MLFCFEAFKILLIQLLSLVFVVGRKQQSERNDGINKMKQEIVIKKTHLVELKTILLKFISGVISLFFTCILNLPRQ